MIINKDNFIDEFVSLSIELGKSIDEKQAMNAKHNNKLVKKLEKYDDFLAKDPIFAKEVLDKLIVNDNFYVMMNVSGSLWSFNYKMKECYKIFDKIIKNKDPQHALSVIYIKATYDSIRDGRQKRRKEFPKLE